MIVLHFWRIDVEKIVVQHQRGNGPVLHRFPDLVFPIFLLLLRLGGLQQFLERGGAFDRLGVADLLGGGGWRLVEELGWNFGLFNAVHAIELGVVSTESHYIINEIKRRWTK